jgi:hypothetical protein
MRYSAAFDSLHLVGGLDSPLGKSAVERAYQASDEVHRTFDRSLVDTKACLGGCALVAPEDQQVAPQSPDQ